MDFSQEYTEAKTEPTHSLIPEGVYYTTVTDWSWSDQYESISMKLEIKCDEDKDEEFQGRILFSNLYFSDKTANDGDKRTKLFTRLKHLGLGDKVNFQQPDLVAFGKHFYSVMNDNITFLKSNVYTVWVSHFNGKAYSTLTGKSESVVTNHAPQTAAAAKASVAEFDAKEDVPF